MASVEGFEQDVFISYAHVDDRPVFNKDGFVTRLHRALDVLVGRRMGRLECFSMWGDGKLRGADRYGPEIEKQIRSSAVFLAVVSPGYVDSTCCLRELATFGTPSPLQASNRSRLFRVDFDRLRSDQTLPTAFDGIDGYQFYEQDRLTDRIRTVHEGKRYEVLVEDLARDIADTLAAMRRAAMPTVDRRTRAAIYLAAVAPEEAERRTSLREAFLQYGITVLPEWTDDPPSNKAAFAAAVNEDLAQASLSLHVVGASYGGHMFGDERNLSLAEMQYDLAVRAATDGRLGSESKEREQSADAARVLVWSPTDFMSDDERQKAFFRQIYNESRLEWFPAGEEAFKDVCLDRLGVLRRTPDLAVAEEGAIVYVSCPSDGRHHEDFAKLVALLKRRGHDLLLPDWAGADELPEDRVRFSDGVLILYVGDVSARWAEQRALEVASLSKRRQKRPIVAAVYDGPPPERDELNFEFNAVRKIRARQGFDETALTPFLEDLRKHATV